MLAKVHFFVLTLGAYTNKSQKAAADLGFYKEVSNE